MESGKLVEITIDGRKVKVSPGITILEAAARAKVEIPTLCHHAELSPSGSCRVCIVEISRPAKDPRRTWIDASCVCPVSEGLVIRTDSPRVVKERKLIIELLLSRAPASRRIRDLARKYGVTEGRFTAADGGKSNCILCGLCVRVCNELIKADAIGTARRGIEKEITSPFRVAGSLCIGCLACARVCPTGVIEFELKKNKLNKKEWGVALDMVFCTECGAPIGTRVQMERLKEKITVRDDLLSFCPACRRKKNYAVPTAALLPYGTLEEGG